MVSILSSVILTSILVILGWLFGRSWHNNISKNDAIRLPVWVRVVLGPPNANGYYNVRGIYFQIFTVMYALPFLLVDLHLISRQFAFWCFAIGMVIFPLLEIIRWIMNKK